MTDQDRADSLRAGLGWAVWQAERHLDEVRAMRAEERCGPDDVQVAFSWLDQCRVALADHPAASSPRAVQALSVLAHIRRCFRFDEHYGRAVIVIEAGSATMADIDAALDTAPQESAQAQGASGEPKADAQASEQARALRIVDDVREGGSEDFVGLSFQFGWKQACDEIDARLRNGDAE